MALTQTVTIDGIIIKETEKAILFQFTNINGVGCKEWFPLSQINKIQQGEDFDTIVVSRWIAQRKEAAE